MRLPLIVALLIAMGAPRLLQAEPLNAELTRIHDILDKGQLKRARGLFKAYLAMHPDSQAAREGYEEAGGDLASLGLSTDAVATTPKAVPQTSPVPTTSAPKEISAASVAAASVQTPAEAPVDGPTWLQRVRNKLARLGAKAGRAMLVVVIILAILLLVVSLGWACIRLAAWHQKRHHDAMLALAAQVGADGAAPSDLYIELRFFTAYWGFLANSEQITNDAIRRLNEQGWVCAKVLRQNRLLPNVPSTKLVLIWLASALSLGFLNYYSGPVLWMRRAPSA